MKYAVLTVIICTHNRSRLLQECLKSLAAQTTSPGVFNILIVDNNSTDDTGEVIKEAVKEMPDIRTVFGTNQGIAQARNRGLTEAQTDWVAFIDDDAKARPDWVERILETIAKGDFDAFGGPYYACHPFGPPPAWLPENFWSYGGPKEYGPLGKFHIAGMNCALKKTAAKAAGGFPINLGMSGMAVAYGEETLLFNRMIKQGYRLGFVPTMRVDHCIMPRKYTVKWLLASAFALGRDTPYAFEAQFSWRGLLGACRRCGKSVCNLLFSCCNVRAPRWKMSLLIAARRVMNAAGELYTMLHMMIKRNTCPRP